MKVLVTGAGGKSGSWQIRGEQLGRAIGATVEPKAQTVRGYDLAVVVKRTPGDLIDRLQRRGIPIVWDVVDAFPQPHHRNWHLNSATTREECLLWLRGMVQTVGPHAIVATTKAMAEDCVEFARPVLALPHHARQGQSANAIRDEVRTVGYEGSEAYLGKWRAVVELECKRRGWTFHVNPSRLADVDIVVALREADGYAERHWKSGVKLANAQATGTPIVCNRERGYIETASGVEQWADTPEELSIAFDALRDVQVRQGISDVLFRATPRLYDVAHTYRRWLAALRF